MITIMNKTINANLTNGEKLEIIFPKDKFIFLFHIINDPKIFIKGDFYLN